MRSMSSALTPARSTAAFTAVAPRSVAEASASAPCIEPMGVRAMERMTVGSSAMVAMGSAPESDCCSAHRQWRRLVQTLRALLAAPLRGFPVTETMLDFDLGEMADTIRETSRRFAKDKIDPIAAEIDEKDEFPRHLWPQMGELGLHGITVEEEDGGLGLGYLEHVVAQEEV